MTVEILVPCLNKSREDILELCDFACIDSGALFCNQRGEDSRWELEYNGHRVLVLNVSWKGVSKARNLLIEQCSADIGVFIDDDCVLGSGYVEAVINAYSTHKSAKAIRFNTTREYWNPVHAEAKKRKRASFRNLSSFGIWGLSFKSETIKNSSLRFNEKLGAPNYLYNGEDSAFLFDLCKHFKEVYLDPFFLCDVRETKRSTWFDEFDERYFTTKGFIYSYLYGKLWKLALLRMYLSYRRSYGMPWREIVRFAKKGRSMYLDKKYDPK